MSAPMLQHNHIFGLKSDVANNIHFVEDNQVLYPAGHNIIIYNLHTKTQRFIHGSDVNGLQGRTEITALAVSPNKRYVAIAERGRERAVCHVYDVRKLKKRKTLNTSEVHSREFTSLCFSPDSKFLLTQGGSSTHGNELVLVNWLWSKSKAIQITPIETRNQPIYQCSFCPADPTLVCVTGRNVLKFFRVDNSATILSEIEASMLGKESQDYLCHEWLGGKKLVVGTRAGTLLYFENTMLRAQLDQNNSMAGGIAGKSVEVVAAYSKGFVVGCDEGMLKVFEADPESHYKLVRIFTVDGNPVRVKSIAISPSDEDVVLSMENQQLFVLEQFDSDMSRSEEMKFKPLAVPFHCGAITGLDVCTRKPEIVTCGMDKSIRVWNYQTRNVELITYFNETPLSVAFHPSGLHVLVGFSDKLRLMNILMDDIRPFKEIPIKGCIECQFSNGGHLFAAANGTAVQIYSSYTGEQICLPLRIHTENVNSIYWSLDDTAIISAGIDGAVYERKLAATARSQEYVQKGCRFTSALCTEDSKIYAVGDDRILKEIVDRRVMKQLDAGVVLTQLVVSHPPQRMLFAGTINGVVRSFKFPLTGDVKDYQCHSKQVRRMRITKYDDYLFTVSDDGCLAIFQIKESDGNVRLTEPPSFAEEILVTKTDLDEKNRLMNDLKGKVDELTASNEYQLRLHDMNYQEKLKEVTEKYTLQIEHDKSKIEMLRDEKTELEIEFDEKLSSLKSAHANQLHAEDLEHQKSIMKEVGRYQNLQENFDGESRGFENETRHLTIAHKENILRLTEKYKMRLSQEKHGCQKVQEGKELELKRYKETIHQLEEDTDKEIEQLKEKYETKFNQERDATLKLKGENSFMNKIFTALQKDIEDQKENIKAMEDKEEKLTQHIKLQHEKIAELKRQIDNRDLTIGDNERNIYDLKKDNQELEKFKFVLDYQIKELKRQIEPRENEITDKKDEVMLMDSQLEAYHKENANLQLEVKELQKKLKKKQNMIRRQRQLYRQSKNALNSLSNDLHEIVQVVQDPIRLKEAVRKLYHFHVTERIQAAEVDPDVAKEYKRQRQYLERSVDVLKRKLTRDMKARKNDNMRVMQENVALIKEINKMRREIKLIHQVQRQKELNTATATTSRQREFTIDTTWNEKEALKILDMQRTQIASLRLQIEQTQAHLMHAQAGRVQAFPQ